MCALLAPCATSWGMDFQAALHSCFCAAGIPVLHVWCAVHCPWWAGGHSGRVNRASEANQQVGRWWGLVPVLLPVGLFFGALSRCMCWVQQHKKSRHHIEVVLQFLLLHGSWWAPKVTT